MKGIVIILAALAVIAVFLFIPISLECDFFYDGNFQKKIILKFLLYKNNLSEKKQNEKKEKKERKKEDKPREKKSIRQIAEEVKYFKRLFKYFKKDIADIFAYAKNKAVKLKSLSVDTAFAGKDPMQTGIYTGVVNGAVYNAVSFIENTVGMGEWSVNIEPNFNSPAFIKAKVHCILNAKPAHIIVILTKIVSIFIKYKKNKKKI